MGTMAVSQIVSDQNLKKMFKELDTNNNGEITEDEMNGAFDGFEKFKSVGYHKKSINFQDFKGIMLKMVKEQEGQKQNDTHKKEKREPTLVRNHDCF